MSRFRKPSTRPSKRICRTDVKCFDGPLCGQILRLDAYGKLNTLPFTLRGETGRYVAGRWEAA